MDVATAVSSSTEESTATRRARCIIFDALALLPRVLAGVRADALLGAVSAPATPRRVHGKATGRDLLEAVWAAWRAGVLDLEGSPSELQERLLAGGYLSHRASPRTWREALRHLSRLCPALVVRVDHFTYALPLGQLRAGGARLEALRAWVDATHALLYARETCGRRLPGEIHVSTPQDQRVDLERSSTRPCSPNSHGLPSDEERALREVRKLGPGVEGRRGDVRLFVAAAIGGDFGLGPEQWAGRLEAYAATCSPPWRLRDVLKKLKSAGRNRKRPWGYRARSGETPPDPRRASAVASTAARPDPAAIWRAAVPVDSFAIEPSAGARTWLAARQIDAARVARDDLARVLVTPIAGAEHDGRSWARGYSLVLPIYDARGTLAGVRARRTTTSHDTPPKELAPRGGRVRETVFANPAARALLAGDTSVLSAVESGRAGVWVVEGAPDFLAMSVRTDDPVIGLYAGAWSAEIAAAVPRGAHVLLATHDDPAGDALARAVVGTFAGDVFLARVRWRGLDVDAAARAGLLACAEHEPIATTPPASTTLATTPPASTTPAELGEGLAGPDLRWLPPQLRAAWLALGGATSS